MIPWGGPRPVQKFRPCIFPSPCSRRAGLVCSRFNSDPFHLANFKTLHASEYAINVKPKSPQLATFLKESKPWKRATCPAPWICHDVFDMRTFKQMNNIKCRKIEMKSHSEIFQKFWTWELFTLYEYRIWGPQFPPGVAPLAPLAMGFAAQILSHLPSLGIVGGSKKRVKLGA